MPSPDTLHDESSSMSLHPDVRATTCLTVLWSRRDAALAGALARLEGSAPPGGWVLGRGDQDEGGDAVGRVVWIRQRPGGDIRVEAPQSTRISRRHLLLARDGEDLVLAATGYLPVKVNTVPVDRCRLQVGDLIEIDRELLLMCESRPDSLPDQELHPFGGADADGLVGETPVIWHLRRQISFSKAARTHTMIWGPSGAGKELVAQALYRRFATKGPLISRNAATFPEGLLDAELFGNAPNYPNPGMPARAGAVGEAHGGVLFLDEIGELSHDMQTHLLRVMDQGEYQRLGEPRARTAKLTMVGATNRSLDRLKHDFLARFPRRITLPGLDERRSDIPLLASHLLEGFQRAHPTLFPDGCPLLHPRFVTRLVLHPYSTHVRELQALLWRAIERWTLAGGGKYLDLKGEFPTPSPPAEARDPRSLTREVILDAYRQFGGVQAHIPAFLGLRNRFQLGRLEKKLGITSADKQAAVGPK